MRQVNLVNDQDQVIGQTDLLTAHRGSGQKHQAISLFLFHQNAAGIYQLLVQQRSPEKIVGGLQWANTLCANLIPNENHLDCLKRRVFEELGIEWKNTFFLEEVMVFPYQVACEKGFAENEIDHIFVSILDDSQFKTLQIMPNPIEVVDYAWLNWDDFKNQASFKKQKIGERLVTPWFNLFLQSESIINKIDKVLADFRK